MKQWSTSIIRFFFKNMYSFLRHKNLCKNIPGVTSFCCSSSSSFRGDENLRAILFDKIDFLTHTIKIKFYYVAFYFTVSDFEVLIFFSWYLLLLSLSLLSLVSAFVLFWILTPQLQQQTMTKWAPQDFFVNIISSVE